MPQRSISDEEIGLIKAMLGRGMKNRDIQFYFNRQDRPVNSGRITQIKDGSYGPATIKKAADPELEAFIKSFKAADIGAVIQAAPATVEQSKSDIAKSLFEKQADGSWKLKDGETDQHECKQDFDPKKLSPVLRAIAAMSNNRGGFLFLGVTNADCTATGVAEAFGKFDIAKLMDKVKVHLAPTPVITTKEVIDFDGLQVGFIHVEPHPYKPVIVCKDDGDKLSEGEILFRYAGQSARIKFTDLQALLTERDRKAQLALADAAGKLATVGTANALILDTDKNVLDADGREILIDEELATSLNFIREGHFDEVDGAPALKLIGEVKPVNVQGKIAEKLVDKAISQERILEAFLSQETVTNPTEYVLAGVSQPRKWLPIFYFVKQAGVTTDAMIEDVKALNTSQKQKKNMAIKRLQGKEVALCKPPSKKAGIVTSAIEKGTAQLPTKAGDVWTYCYGFCAAKSTTMNLADVMAALNSCYALASQSGDANAIGAVFKAVCRADEMFFTI
jgi:hypothetical protein